MSEQDIEKLDQRDWGAEWARLPKAELPTTLSTEPTQVTLRISKLALAQLKRLAAEKTLPYHSLARSWLLDGIRDFAEPDADIQAADIDMPADAQLNIKLSSDKLQAIKAAGDRLRTPYHRLMRLWVYQALREHTATTSTTSTSSIRPTLRETMLLLLHAKGPKGRPDEEVRGVTRLVKLLFLATDRMGRAPDVFYAHAYGPFSEGVYDAREALEREGLLEGSDEPTDDLPSFDRMAAVAGRKGRGQVKLPAFRLSQRGAAAADKLLSAEPTYQAVLSVAEQVKREYGNLTEDELIERVYAERPEYTGESLIVDEVAERAEKRRRGAV